MSQELVLSVGTKAYLDTGFSGLVPCVVLEIKHPEYNHSQWNFTLTLGGIDCGIKTRVRVTEDHGPYKKGEIVDDDAAHTVPRKAVHTKGYHIWIKGYRVDKPNRED